MIYIRFIDGRIEFDQNITGFDLLPIMNVNGTNNASIEGLDDLDAPTVDNLSGRGCNDIDRPKARPGERKAKNDNDRCNYRAAYWRWRCLDDLQGGRQKGNVFLVTTLG